jgi:SAM-dependent methyltransferase
VTVRALERASDHKQLDVPIRFDDALRLASASIFEHTRKAHTMAFYSEGFYAGIGPGSRSSAQVVLPLVFDLIRPRRVADIGCGSGTWLAVARELGVERVLGVDGVWVTPQSLQIPVESFRSADLCDPLALTETFDLVISVEAAEHLPESRAAGFVADLVSLGKAVLFSGAIPRQGGDRHINEQWQAYWADLFAKHGYAAVDCVRPAVWSDTRVDYWYAQNAILYVAKDLLDSNPALQQAHARTHPTQLSVVHPQLFAMRARRSKFKQRTDPFVSQVKLLRDKLRGR